MSKLHDFDEHVPEDDGLETHRQAERKDLNLGRSAAAGGMASADAVGLDWPGLRAEFRRDFLGALVAPDTEFLVVEMFEWLAEKGLLVGRTKPVDYTEAQRMAVFSAILTYTYEHNSLADQFAARWVFDQPWLDDMIGHLTQKQFADGANVSKQRVLTAVKQARAWFTAKGFKLPYRDGEERGADARDNMKKAYASRNRKAVRHQPRMNTDGHGYKH